MKKNYFLRCIASACIIVSSLCISTVLAQTIKFVPYPNGNTVTYNVLRIFPPVIYNDKLYSTATQIAINFTDTTVTEQLPQLASYDGTSITLIPNVNKNIALDDMVGVFKNKLYAYTVDTTLKTVDPDNPDDLVAFFKATQMVAYNGSSFSFVPLPGSSAWTDVISSLSYYPYNFRALISNGNLFLVNFITDTLSPNIATAKFDGTQFTAISDPSDIGSVGGLAPLNNNFFLSYISSSLKGKLEQFNGNGYSPTSIPDNFSVSYLATYNNKMYLTVNTGIGILQLGIFDGNSFSLVPNPDAGSTENFVHVFNNKIYFSYLNQAGTYQLAEFNGSSIRLISNPDNSDNAGFGGAIVYNNKLYFQYKNSSGIYQLGQFDGNSITLIQNPDNGIGVVNLFSYGQQAFPPHAIIFNNKLFFSYVGLSSANQLAQFDGNSLTTIPNPDNVADFGSGFGNDYIVYKNKLYFTYLSDSGIARLSYLDETETVPPNNLLPAKPTTEYASYEYTDGSGWTNYYYDNNTPADFTDDTLLLSIKKNGQNIGSVGDGTFSVKLAATDGAGSNTGIKVTNPLITNPSGFWAMNRYWQVTTNLEPSTPVGVRFYYNNQDLKDLNGSYPSHSVTNNNLIFYKADGGNPDPSANLAGITKLISLLPAAYASESTWTYHSFNDTAQYAEFSVSSFSGGGGGATGNNGALPVALLNFFAQLQNNNTILNWQTATENNTSYFSILRSVDGSNFKSIGNVSAVGNSSVINSYTYTDADVANLKAGKLFYQLQEIDKDGKSTYSKIDVVNFSGVTSFTISPNPIKDFVNIVSGADVNNAVIKITDMNGKILVTTKESFTQGSSLQLPVGNLSKGVYMVMIETASGKSDYKIVKE